MLNRILDIKRTDQSNIIEPISLEEAKSWLKVDFEDDDNLIETLIIRCREAIEEQAHISIVLKDIILTVDLYNDIELPYGPLGAITEVLFRQSTNTDGTPDYETLTAEDYRTDGVNFITFRSLRCGRHKITYTTGYNCAVPKALKLAILNEIAWWYERRGDETFTEELAPSTLKSLKPYIRLAWL